MTVYIRKRLIDFISWTIYVDTDICDMADTR